MLSDINGELSLVNCSRISEPSADSSRIPAEAVAIHFLFPPSTSISVIWVLPKTYSTFPSKLTFMRCGFISPTAASKTPSELYKTANPASVPIQISLSKSTAIAVMLEELISILLSSVDEILTTLSSEALDSVLL